MTAFDLHRGKEAARLVELRRLRVLDSDPDPEVDLIAQTAAALFSAPIALISLIDEHRQWFKASVGFELPETPRDVALCAHAIEHPHGVMLVPDATLDERFAGNPLVTGEPGIRFYAAAPLVSSNGFAVGSLCIIDRKPRAFSAEQSRALVALSVLAMRLIERHAEPVPAMPARIESGPASAPVLSVFGWDRNGLIASWNDTAQAMLGWSAAEVMGLPPPFLMDADRQRFMADCRDALGGSGFSTRVCTIRTKAQHFVQVALRVTRAVDPDGRASGLSTIEMIGAQVAMESRLAMLESVLANSTDAVIVTLGSRVASARNRIIYVNEAFTRMTGYAADEAIGDTPRMLQGRGTDPAVLARISKALELGEAVSAELLNYRKDGSEFWVDLNISPIVDRDGRCLYFVAVQREATSRRAGALYEHDRSLVLEMAIRNEPLATQLARIVVLLKSVIPGSMGTVMLLEDDRLVGGAADPDLPADYIAAIDGVQIGPETGSCGTAAYLREPVLCGDIATDYRWRAYRDLAEAAGLRACWSIPLFATNGDVVGAYALYADRAGLPTRRQLQLFQETARFAELVIERHRDRQRLERSALYDALTDLPNRKLVEEALAAAIERARMSGKSVALGALDLDRFKAINDAFGHHVGDELLRSIADRLVVSLGEADIIGRMAGDEFVMVFADLDESSAGIEAATRVLELFSTPFNAGGYEIFVRPSLGLAFYPATSAELTGLFQSADKAMFAAKARGGGIELASIPIAGSAMKALDLEKDLRYALDRDEFTLHYQMMFDLANGRPVGAEALLRWNHPELGLIGPVDFIPIAEANGTIVQIGTWVIDEAARVARGWQDDGHDAFVTVNVSALQFDAPGLVASVVEALERNGLEPHRLHLELTESLVMRNPSNSAATLLQLKALGVRIVIDDFGTGYSSLAYLQRFTFDALKIDRAFVSGIGDNASSERSEHIVAAVVALGRALGVTTIAEGVEDAAQYAFVQSCGCTVVQGFLCARPVPAAELIWPSRALLRSHR